MVVELADGIADGLAEGIARRGSGEQLRAGFETSSTGIGAAGRKPLVATFR